MDLQRIDYPKFLPDGTIITTINSHKKWLRTNLDQQLKNTVTNEMQLISYNVKNFQLLGSFDPPDQPFS